MFERSDTPRIFGLPPGVDFPQALIDGLSARLQGSPPEAMGRVQLIVNTRRMARRIRTLFDQGPARLLPRVSLVTNLSEAFGLYDVPGALPSLRRRLELSQLVAGLLDREPTIAPRSAMYDLADSLAALMDEMQGEGVTPDAIEALDISDVSGHWDRILTFLNIVKQVYASDNDLPDAEARQRMIITRLIRDWQACPPQHPIILAGSTGSRGSTLMLMQAVAKLPQGGVVLPGFDFDMPDDCWQALLGNGRDALPLEDHPQFRFLRVLTELGLDSKDVTRWHNTQPPNPHRNRLVSLALRPVPVTDQWLSDGPALGDLNPATKDVTLLESPSSRIEALTIAMRLRQAAKDGQVAALITPDRTLTRQVAAALDRWDILADDSAGQPLHLSPPGRFLRHVAELFRAALTTELLLSILKHPLTHSGGNRGTHLRMTRELELHLRREGVPFPNADTMQTWAVAQTDPFAVSWAQWVVTALMGAHNPGAAPLHARVTQHLALAEQIADGSEPAQTSELWREKAGRKAQDIVQTLVDEAPHGGTIGAQDYTSLIYGLLSGEEVRNPEVTHPDILIWGTLEARVQGADLVILAGLNEGSWPGIPSADPWLNRALRHQAGLLLPERRIGLSAHDFQQAIGAREVWLTRSQRSDDAETVPSRWLNRLTNLMAGLPDQGGKAALEHMRDRGAHWIKLAAALEAPHEIEPARRPSPCPPQVARPLKLSVTEIKKLIRDPYAIYARHVLRLRPLNPLMHAPDALLRGIVLHGVLEHFIRETADAPELCTRERLMEKTVSVLAQSVPWAEARATWLARMERVADWFVDHELIRRAHAQPTAYEVGGRIELPDLGFRLTAEADRIDVDAEGRLHIYDYKTGSAPSENEQMYFDKQLLLEAVIAERSGFGEIPASEVAHAVFIGLSSNPKEVPAPLEKEPTDKVWSDFQTLIQTYLDPKTGFTARRAMHQKSDISDYDQLARFGEWDITARPDKKAVG